MNWLKQNWLALAFLGVILVIGLSFSFFKYNTDNEVESAPSLFSESSNTTQENDSISQQESPLLDTYRNSISWLPLYDTVCLPQTAAVCGSGTCNDAEPKVFNLISHRRLEGKATLYRCDIKGCDDYEAQITNSGDYVVYDVPTNPGFFLKREVGLMTKYAEVVTLGTAAQTSMGYCSAIGAPIGE